MKPLLPLAGEGRNEGAGRPHIFAAVTIAALFFSLAGCGSSPPPPPAPTVVQLTLSTTPDTNATPSGQGAPLPLRVYQLASPASFESAEFHRLYDNDSATLGTDLLKRDSYLLPPGTSRSVTLMPSDQARAIGDLAAYREFQSKTWRAAADIPPHQTTVMTVTANADGIKLTVAPASAAR